MIFSLLEFYKVEVTELSKIPILDIGETVVNIKQKNLEKSKTIKLEKKRKYELEYSPIVGSKKM
jgi:hypothetical protein